MSSAKSISSSGVKRFHCIPSRYFHCLPHRSIDDLYNRLLDNSLKDGNQLVH